MIAPIDEERVQRAIVAPGSAGLDDLQNTIRRPQVAGGQGERAAAAVRGSRLLGGARRGGRDHPAWDASLRAQWQPVPDLGHERTWSSRATGAAIRPARIELAYRRSGIPRAWSGGGRRWRGSHRAERDRRRGRVKLQLPTDSAITRVGTPTRPRAGQLTGVDDVDMSCRMHGVPVRRLTTASSAPPMLPATAGRPCSLDPETHDPNALACPAAVRRDAARHGEDVRRIEPAVALGRVRTARVGQPGGVAGSPPPCDRCCVRQSEATPGLPGTSCACSYVRIGIAPGFGDKGVRRAIGPAACAAMTSMRRMRCSRNRRASAISAAFSRSTPSPPVRVYR